MALGGVVQLGTVIPVCVRRKAALERDGNGVGGYECLYAIEGRRVSTCRLAIIIALFNYLAQESMLARDRMSERERA